MLRKWVSLGVLVLLASATLAQDARLDPAALLLPPIPSNRRVVTSPQPDDEPDLPPRAATLRYTPEPSAAAPLTAAQIRQVRNETPAPRGKPLSGEELFEYLADVEAERRETGRTRRRRADDRTTKRDPTYDAPADRIGESDEWYFGKHVGGLFQRDREKEGWFFCSDHDFESMISPVTNPFLFEDPRALSEVRPIFIYQNIPNGQPNFQGGDIWFAGAQGRVAFTERLSLTINKLGAVGVNSNSPNQRDGTGFAELWFGPKYTFYRDDQSGFVAAGGVQFQLPIGGGNVYQNTGDLSIVPYASFGKSLMKTGLGTFNALGSTGYAFSVNKERSNYLYASGHVSLDVMDRHKFFPLFELNWFQYATDGNSNFIKGEGLDLVNFGSIGRGSGLLTGAVGARYRFTRHIEAGGAFEFPLSGNRDFFENRFTVDLIFRY